MLVMSVPEAVYHLSYVYCSLLKRENSKLMLVKAISHFSRELQVLQNMTFPSCISDLLSVALTAFKKAFGRKPLHLSHAESCYLNMKTHLSDINQDF